MYFCSYENMLKQNGNLNIWTIHMAKKNRRKLADILSSHASLHLLGWFEWGECVWESDLSWKEVFFFDVWRKIVDHLYVKSPFKPLSSFHLIWYALTPIESTIFFFHPLFFFIHLKKKKKKRLWNPRPNHSLMVKGKAGERKLFFGVSVLYHFIFPKINTSSLGL